VYWLMRFRGAPYDDLVDGGRALSDALRAELPELSSDAVVVTPLSAGAIVGRVVADQLGLRVVALRVTENEFGTRVELVGAEPAELVGRTLLFVDAGVQSGATALNAIAFLRSLKPSRLVMAVPTCHAQAAADVTPLVDVLIAPHRPFTPRTLRWEYKVFAPPADEAAALAALQPLGLG
jgi:predicted phosphoribosyltransferase